MKLMKLSEVAASLSMDRRTARRWLDTQNIQPFVFNTGKGGRELLRYDLDAVMSALCIKADATVATHKHKVLGKSLDVLAAEIGV